MQVTKNFVLEEFVPPIIHSQFGDNSIWFINQYVPRGVQLFRDLIGKPVLINNWHTDGQFKYSGYRDHACGIGAFNSMHRLGLAVDIKVDGMSGSELAEFVKKHWSELSTYFTTMEDPAFTATWVHLDARWVKGSNQQPLIVKP